MEPSPIPRRVIFLTSGIHPNIYISEIDSHFICKLCYLVVRQPVACQQCEAVYCRKCIEISTSLRDLKCKSCKNELVIERIRRFPTKVYDSYILFCENYNNGCRVHGTHNDISAHLPDCEFSFVSCDNELCRKQVLRKNLNFPGSQACSRNCLEVCEFKKILEAGTSPDCLLFFYECIEKHRLAVIEEMEAKIQKETCAKHTDKSEEAQNPLKFLIENNVFELFNIK